LEETGKKLALVQLKVLDKGKPLIHSIRIVGIPAQIWTGHLPNTNRKS